MGEHTWSANQEHLSRIGTDLTGSRMETLGHMGEQQNAHSGQLNGARNEFPGGIKVTVFPFSPTSERLAEWLCQLAKDNVEDCRVKVLGAKIFESLHPTESIAEYTL
jgi:hypothetical protein